MFKKILPALLVVGYSLSLHADLHSVDPLLEYHDLVVTHSLEAGSLKVNDNAKIDGNLTVKGHEKVKGSVKAESFITPDGALFNGLRNYAVLSNQTEVPISGTNVIPWAATAAASVSSGISVNGEGYITLPSTGIFLIQYSVRISRSPPGTDITVVAQLQQTVSGTSTNIGQAAIINNLGYDMAGPAATPQYSLQLTGFAIVNVTSDDNNVIDLTVTLGDNTSVTIPAATGVDANAQMTILQLN